MTSGYRASASPPVKKRKSRLVAKPQYWPAYLYGASVFGVLLTSGLSLAGASNYEHDRVSVLAEGALYTELLALVAGVSNYLWFGMTWQLLPPARQVTEHGRRISPGRVWGLQLVPIVNIIFTWFLAKQIRHSYNEMVEEYRRTHRIRRLPLQLAFGLPLVGVVLVAMAALTAEDPLLYKVFLGAGGVTFLSAQAAFLRFMFAVDKAKGLIAVAAPGALDVLR